MRGFSRFPGLVAGEACDVRVRDQLPPNVDFTGRAPSVLFQQTLDASVIAVGERRPEGGWYASARLLPMDLQTSPHAELRPFYDREPGPHLYEVVPRQYMNGLTREDTIRVNGTCFIWIKPEGVIPWLEADADDRPDVPAGFPIDHLVGFWRARVTASLKHRDGSPVRRLRAVFNDPRIRDHRLAAVRQFHGHEPWTPYSATLTDNELVEAGSELLDDLAAGAQRLARHLELPAWLRRPPGSGGAVWQSDDFAD